MLRKLWLVTHPWTWRVWRCMQIYASATLALLHAKQRWCTHRHPDSGCFALISRAQRQWWHTLAHPSLAANSRPLARFPSPPHRMSQPVPTASSHAPSNPAASSASHSGLGAEDDTGSQAASGAPSRHGSCPTVFAAPWDAAAEARARPWRCVTILATLRFMKRLFVTI